MILKREVHQNNLKFNAFGTKLLTFCHVGVLHKHQLVDDVFDILNVNRCQRVFFQCLSFTSSVNLLVQPALVRLARTAKTHS